MDHTRVLYKSSVIDLFFCKDDSEMTEGQDLDVRKGERWGGMGGIKIHKQEG